MTAAALSIANPFQTFTGANGQPLNDGRIYVGTVGLNPRTNPVQVYFDADMTIPAAQPIRTINGYPSRDGSPATIYLAAGDCSVLVTDRAGSLVFSALSIAQRVSASQVMYTPPGTGAVTTTVQTKLREFVSVKDFGAVGDGVADDTSAFTNALATGKLVFVPIGTYKIVGNLRIDEGGLIGEAVGVAGGQFSQLKFYNCTTTTVGAVYTRIASQKSAFVRLENLWISASSWDGTTGALGYGLDIESPVLAKNVTVIGFNKSGVFLHNDASGAGPYESVLQNVNSYYNGGHGFLIGAGANALQIQACQGKWNGATSFGVAPASSGSYDGVYVANTSDGAGPYYSFTPTSVTIIGGDFSYNSRYGINVSQAAGMWMNGSYVEQCLSADSCQNSVGSGISNSYLNFGFAVTGAGTALKFNNSTSSKAQQNTVISNGYSYAGAVSGTRIYDKHNSIAGPSAELKDRYIYLGADDVGATNHTALLASLDGNTYFRSGGTGKWMFDTGSLYFASGGSVTMTVSGSDLKYQGSGKHIFPNGLCLDNGGTVKFLTGNGSPEGVVTAFVGSIYTNYSGGAGTTLYVKQSGSGNTGWVAK